MHRLIIILLSLCLTINVSAQDYMQKGNTFIEVDTTANTSTNKSSSIETEYIWIDKNGVSYNIWLSKNGRAFVKMTSKRTGKQYNKYLSEELSRAICKKLNRQYIVNPNKL